MDAALQAAIDGLYRAFEAYERPPWFEACECCTDGEPIDDVFGPGGRGRVRVASPGGSRPIRELPAEEVDWIGSNVPLTSGTIDLLKHYLPRLLELCVTDRWFWPDLEVVLSSLNLGPEYDCVPWTDWPASEQRALDAFLVAVWRDQLASTEDDELIDRTIEAIACVDPNFDRYLEMLLEFETPAAAMNLVRFLQANAYRLGHDDIGGKLGRVREPSRTNGLKIAAWATADSTREAVARAAENAGSTEERDALEECYLRWLG